MQQSTFAGVARSVRRPRSPVASRAKEVGVTMPLVIDTIEHRAGAGDWSDQPSAGLPLARAAEGEHAFGEDRGRAGAAEHPRVGATPVPGEVTEWPKVPAC